MSETDLDLLKTLEKKYKETPDIKSDSKSKRTKITDLEDDTVKVAPLIYQIPHIVQLISILKENGTVLDCSDTGSGKTFVAAFATKKLDLTPIIICPKSVMHTWKAVMKQVGVKPLFVVNYETITRGKYYKNKQRIECPELEYSKEKKGKITKLHYNWKVDKNVIFIFDEAHKCKSLATANGKLLIAAKKTGNKILMASATIVDKPKEFVIFGYVLGISDNLRALHVWLRHVSNPALAIHKAIFPDRASRMSIAELGDLFPKTQITAEAYSMSSAKEISDLYAEIGKSLELVATAKRDVRFYFSDIQNKLQKIELLKIPTIAELVEDFLENKFSIVIFVNYTKTLELLAAKLGTDCLVHGSQTIEERNINVKRFQEDKSRIIICNIKAGGVGISLHDVRGEFSRVSLICPTWSATDLKQALGRVHRAGAQSRSLQRIIYAAGTIEEAIAKSVSKKLQDVALINDGELEGYLVQGLQRIK